MARPATTVPGSTLWGPRGLSSRFSRWHARLLVPAPGLRKACHPTAVSERKAYCWGVFCRRDVHLQMQVWGGTKTNVTRLADFVAGPHDIAWPQGARPTTNMHVLDKDTIVEAEHHRVPLEEIADVAAGSRVLL
eukprot:CAMPEP_0206317370 /NCGR_PEP_ID=MMETSP0106_2-20121207/16605_1 /ASSEMBLY_ACC=CAM_ASM_000206 /TAXON_ID=81532 /ORGANISM="Acanthoeca-like sp., Strain 10tr" /LENGTH=133 /DNA_ID=CAMNT_0053748969 /DNA_START=226 /DNA_END=623 /DNA_ORIENTATION=-